MRAMFASPVAMLALLAGCQPAAEESPASENRAVAPNEAALPPANVAAEAANAAQAVKIESKDDVLEFTSGWPAQAAAIPALDEWLRGNMDSHRKRALAQARADAKAAKESAYPFRGHAYAQTWAVTADTPALLVLEAQGYEYTGGAHGMPFIATLIWDKAKQQRLATGALLDVGALARLSKARYCKALDAQRAEKRGEPVDPKADSVIPEFNQCVPLEKQEIVPVSKSGKAIDTVRIEILPYEAGPYSEGIYSIDLPLDPALMGAVKPAWKAAFAPAG